MTKLTVVSVSSQAEHTSFGKQWQSRAQIAFPTGTDHVKNKPQMKTFESRDRAKLNVSASTRQDGLTPSPNILQDKAVSNVERQKVDFKPDNQAHIFRKAMLGIQKGIAGTYHKLARRREISPTPESAPGSKLLFAKLLQQFMLTVLDLLAQIFRNVQI